MRDQHTSSTLRYVRAKATKTEGLYNYYVGKTIDFKSINDSFIIYEIINERKWKGQILFALTI